MATSILELNLGNRGKVKDRTGVRSGMLIAIEFAGKNKKKRQALWRCLCDCGKEVIVSGTQLNGHQQSCGCIKSAITKRHPIDWTVNITHNDSGKSRSKEYIAWSCMIQRCTNKNHASYKNYGGRGISVCKEWIESYEIFLADMGRKPSQNHSLDRINHDAGYGKGNCRWATQDVQQNNKRSNKTFMFNGEKLTCTSISRLIGIPSRTVFNWLENKTEGQDVTTAIEAKIQLRRLCR